MIPLADASRRPKRFPIVTAAIILLNAIVFLFELLGGEPFVKQWSVLPADIVSGQHWVTIISAMFMHGGWMHIIGNMVFLKAFGPEIEDAMGRLRYSAGAPSHLRWGACDTRPFISLAEWRLRWRRS